MDALRERQVSKHAPAFIEAITAQIEAAANRYGDGDIPDVAIEDETDGLQDAIWSLWGDVAILFAGRLYDAMEGEIKSHGQDEIEGWNEALDEYLDTYTAEEIRHVNTETKRFVREIIERSVEEGMSVQQIKDEIKDRWTSVQDFRAERIARTEVLSASNYGSDEAARTLAENAGVTLRKEWLAWIDDRTRDDHIEMNGKTADMDEPFLMPDGSRMMRPGDPAGSAAQIILCRCTLTYTAS